MIDCQTLYSPLPFVAKVRRSEMSLSWFDYPGAFLELNKDALLVLADVLKLLVRPVMVYRRMPEIANDGRYVAVFPM